MPDPDIEVDLTSVVVEWGTLRFRGPGTLRLTSEALHVDSSGGGSLLARYVELRGGAYRTGALTVHGETGNAVVESTRGLDQAWVSLVARACPLPELARGHRLLGSRRGGAMDAQAKFLAPLLQARKRVEEESDLDARVAALDPKALRERFDAALKAIARDTYPSSHPDRRGLEAELEEAMAAFFAGIDVLTSAAGDFRSAPDAIRFMAWRDWVSAVSNVFALADSGGANVSRLLPLPLPFRSPVNP